MYQNVSANPQLDINKDRHNFHRFFTMFARDLHPQQPVALVRQRVQDHGADEKFGNGSRGTRHARMRGRLLYRRYRHRGFRLVDGPNGGISAVRGGRPQRCVRR